MTDPSDRQDDLMRRSGVALWRQIQSRLEQDIASGVLAPGARLPTEKDLAERHGVNRHTVRQAIAALEEAGLVTVEQGRGSFVRDQGLEYRLSDRTRFSENVTRQKRTPGGRLIRAELAVLEPSVARLLNLPPDTQAPLIERLTEVDGRVVARAEHYFHPRTTGILEVYRETGSITESLRRIGIEDYTRAWTRIQAAMPGAQDAILLALPRHRPLLITESLNVDMHGEPLEVGIARYASDRVTLTVDHAVTTPADFPRT